MLDTNKLRKALNVAKGYLFVAYIKFADRWHNPHTCQKKSDKSILKNISFSKTLLIPIARNLKLGCHKMADELLDSCMLAQYPAAHENITKSQKAFANSYRKSINKTINAIRSSCGDNVNIENIDGTIELPCPI